MLEDVSFSIEVGDCIALIGLNGAGKSTLIKLLLRLYEPTKGIIYINGYPSNLYDLDQLRQCISTYQQNEPNFSFSIRQNITLSFDDGDENTNKIIQCIEWAQAGRLLKQMPQGLDTYLGKSYSNHAVELSGGENQRISLCRSFYWMKNLLVLDEPFSALDASAEQEVMKYIGEMQREKICLFSSHHLFTTKIANKIVVLEKGRVVEVGNKQELAMKNGRYRQLLDMQNVSIQSVLS